MSSAPAHAMNVTWEPHVSAPAYAPGKGPVVLVDESHYNFHTIDNLYRPLAQALERDGYVLRRARDNITDAHLRSARILLIATPLASENSQRTHWSPPIAPAFTEAEIRMLQKWVRGGGSLLLISDHLPFAGAMASLASAFGFKLLNGYALDKREINGATLNRPFNFTRRDDVNLDGTVSKHAITGGRNRSERVERVMTFMGGAFRADGAAYPLLVLGENIRSYQTDTFGKLSATTPSVSATGLFQAAARNYGKGRMALFAEAGMFSTQPGSNPVGMNHPGAGDNLRLLLNTLHWLDGTLK